MPKYQGSKQEYSLPLYYGKKKKLVQAITSFCHRQKISNKIEEFE